MIETVDKYLTEAYRRLDIGVAKVDCFTEAAVREHEIMYGQAELKVLKESGTADDLAYLYEEADQSLIERLVAALKKFKQMIIEAFSKIKDKVLSTIGSKEQKENLDKLEKKVKVFPLLGRKKIIVEDYDKQKKVADKHMSLLDKLKAKLKSGQKVDPDDVDEVEKSFMEEHGKTIGIAAALTVTLVAGIAIVKHMMGKSGEELSETQKKAVDSIDEGIKNVQDSKVSDPALAQKIAKTQAKIAKTAAEDFTRTMADIMTKIKQAIRGTKNTVVDTKAVKKALQESTGYTTSNFDSFFESDDTADAPVDQKDLEAAAKEADSQMGDVTTEDGYDCGVDCCDVPAVDDEPDTDPWDDIMRDDDDIDYDVDDYDECGDKAPTLEAAYKEVFGCDYCDNKTKPSNEKLVSDLFDEVMSEVKCKKTQCEPAPVKESAFDSLMAEIDDLF